MKWKNYKCRGEWVEAMFVARALREDLLIFQAWGASGPIDWIVVDGAKISRVQVRGTTCWDRNGGYCCATTHRRNGKQVSYRADEIDFFVAYVIPEDTWYILPASVIANHTDICPGSRKYSQNREAWHLLRQQHKGKKSTAAS